MTKIVDNTNLGYIFSKIKGAFWKKTDIVQVSIDSTPTANSQNLVESGGVKSYVDNAIPSVPVQDVTVGGSSVVSSGTAVIPAIPDEVVANPTVPSGTTPTTLENVKVGNNYFGLAAYPKYYLCADEAEYEAIQNPDAGTLYLIPES